MCPRHSVCVPCPCGLNEIFLKFTLPPAFTEPINPFSITGSIFGKSTYQALGFSLVLDNGIEISNGLEVSMLPTPSILKIIFDYFSLR